MSLLLTVLLGFQAVLDARLLKWFCSGLQTQRAKPRPSGSTCRTPSQLGLGERSHRSMKSTWFELCCLHAVRAVSDESIQAARLVALWHVRQACTAAGCMCSAAVVRATLLSTCKIHALLRRHSSCRRLISELKAQRRRLEASHDQTAAEFHFIATVEALASCAAILRNGSHDVLLTAALGIPFWQCNKVRKLSSRSGLSHDKYAAQP